MIKWYVQNVTSDKVGKATLWCNGRAVWFNQNWDMLEEIAKALNNEGVEYRES